MKIILTTANARYTHCAFGLLRLAAVLEARSRPAQIQEYTIKHSPFEMAENLLAAEPDVIGFGVYIWNVELITHVAHLIRSVRPRTIIVFGGPEMHDAQPGSPLHDAADYIIVGEADIAFADLVEQLSAQGGPKQKVLNATPPALEELPSPYEAYGEEDVQNRILYVESTRGCPYRCAFCLSSLDEKVRFFPLDPFLASMQRLLERGVRLFKFADRTFNIHEAREQQILQFFLQQPHRDIQLHFEIMADRLCKGTLDLMTAFPPEVLHLELGIQSFNPLAQTLIGRNQHLGKTMETIAFLREKTGALLHADLIIGLPGDGVEHLAQGFNALVHAGVHHIQVGLLKRLKGTPLAGGVGRELTFDNHPPYEVLQTPSLSFSEVQRLKRVSRYFDMYYNSGNFLKSLNLLWETDDSPFAAFCGLSDYLWKAEGRSHGLPLARLAEHLYNFLCASGQNRSVVAKTVEDDFRRLPGRCDKLAFIKTADNR